jgi:signal peptidase I
VVREVMPVAILITLVFLGAHLFVRTFRVDGTSMEPALAADQFLLIGKVAYLQADGTPFAGRLPATWQGSVEYPFGGPRRGDVAVFRSPVERNKSYVKRIIGLPGEEVLVKDGDVFVNGLPLDEPYVRFPAPDTYTYPRRGRPLRVPDGKYFVLGDNRPESADSRSGWLVPAENLVGRAWLSYWPPTTWGPLPREVVRERPAAAGAESRPVAGASPAASSAGRTPQPAPTRAPAATASGPAMGQASPTPRPPG